MMNRTDTARRGLGLVVLLTAAALLALAWPRFQAGFHFLPVDTALARYFKSGDIPSGQLDGLIVQATQAIALHDHYRYHEGLSVLHQLRALDSQTPQWERQPEFRRAIQSARAALAAAPAKPRTWLRIARIQAYLGVSGQEVLRPLRMSILTGRVEPSLMLARLELGYRYLPGLDEETTALLRDQTVLAWRVDPRGLTRALKDGRMNIDRVRSLLSEGGQDIIVEMEASLGPPA